MHPKKASDIFSLYQPGWCGCLFGFLCKRIRSCKVYNSLVSCYQTWELSYYYTIIRHLLFLKLLLFLSYLAVIINNLLLALKLPTTGDVRAK